MARMAYFVLLILIVLGGAAVALLSKNLIRAAVALGAASAGLSLLFFFLDAPYAAGFELSVGAGLISVLFIIAITLAQSVGGHPDET